MVLARLGQRQVHRDVAVHRKATAQIQTSLEHLHVQEAVLGLGLPEGRDDLGVQAADVARFRRQTGALPLPVVLSGCRDAIAIVPPANHVGLLEGIERSLYFGEA